VPYPRTLKKDQFDLISPIIDKLAQLSPGKSIVCSCETATALSRLRSTLYSYFHLSSTKNYYRIKTISSTEFLITRLDNVLFKIRDASSRGEDFAATHLIGQSFEMAKRILSCAVQAQDLTEEESREALEKWTQINQ